MSDSQLLTKQVIADDLDATGSTISVRFNLQRGKIARIWGFRQDWSEVSIAGTQEYSVFVRKTSNADRQDTPPDILWSTIWRTDFAGGGGFGHITGNHIMFPLPHRTAGITVQMHRSAGSGGRGVLIIYYDIADVTKGELVQTWEKNISKGRTRRTISP